MDLDLLASSCLSDSSQPMLPLCCTGMLGWVLPNTLWGLGGTPVTTHP